MKLMTLLAPHGGLSLDDPVADSNHKHSDSIECFNRLVDLILEGEMLLPHDHVIPDCAAIKAVRTHHHAGCSSSRSRHNPISPIPQIPGYEGSKEERWIKHTHHHPYIAEHGFLLLWNRKITVWNLKSPLCQHWAIHQCWHPYMRRLDRWQKYTFWLKGVPSPYIKLSIHMHAIIVYTVDPK